MAHHSTNDDRGIDEAISKASSGLDAEEVKRRLAELEDAAGPTGRFPEGKIHDDDEGEIGIVVGRVGGVVVIEFGTPVRWVGFTPEQALGIAELLVNHAREAKAR